MAQPLITLVDWKKYRFLIMDAPNDVNLHIYVEQLQKHHVSDVVRVCEKTYDESKVESNGIKMHVRCVTTSARPPGRPEPGARPPPSAPRRTVASPHVRVRPTPCAPRCDRMSGPQELAFTDGAAPPTHVLDTWLALVDQRFKHGDSHGTIAVHCVAGLGRCVA